MRLLPRRAFQQQSQKANALACHTGLRTHTHTKSRYSTVDAHTSCQPVTAEGSPPIHQLRGLIGCFKPCTVFLVRSLRKRREIKKSLYLLYMEVTQFGMKIKTSQMLWDLTRGSQVRARPVRTGPVDACGKQATRRANTNIHALHFPSFLCLSLCPLCCSFLPFLMVPPPRAPGASKGASQPSNGRKKTGPRANKDYTDVAFQRATPPRPAPCWSAPSAATRGQMGWDTPARASVRCYSEGTACCRWQKPPNGCLGLGVNDSGRRWFALLDNARGNLKVGKFSFPG